MSKLGFARVLIAWCAALFTAGLIAGCPGKPAQEPTIDGLIPASATRAEIPPGYGSNHTELRGSIMWAQGFKYDGDIDKLLAELEVKLNPMGYRLEDHRNYRENYGDTGVSNAKVLRMFRGRGLTVGVFDFTCLPSQGDQYANFAVTLRNR